MKRLKSNILFYTAICVLILGMGVTVTVTFITSCKSNTGKHIPNLILAGSETELPLITNFGYEYQEKNSVEISISGGGSNKGIRELMDGTIDIANSSRIITEEEKNKLEGKKTKWVQAIIGVDAIAIISHPSLHFESIAFDQLSAIFSGKITNWMQIGGPDRPINLYGRSTSSGTHDFMKHRLGIANYGKSIREFNTYGEILAAVKNDSNAIAYVSAASITQNVSRAARSVFVMKVFMENEMDLSPFDSDAINSGDYALIRPLFQYYDASNTNPEIRKFIQFEISPRGQGLLKLYGYYPINVFHKQINSFYGFQ